METGKAIYKLLKDSTDVGAICADRIYPELAQQDVDAPFVVYTVTDTTPSDTKNSTSKLDTARVELYCVSDDYEQSMDLGIAVRTALDRQSGTISGVEVQSIDFDTSDIQFDADQRVYVLEQTYDVRIQRTGTATVVSQFPGNTFTVEEVDGDPSGAVNKLVFSNGTVTIDGNTATVVSGGGAAGDSYHGRYDTEAESERAGATGNVEYYYTARPDGDGEAESEISDTGETDTINRTLAYSTKFRADPDTAADWTDYTTQPADNASFATAKAALLAGLNETDATAETRGTLPVSLKMTRTTSAAQQDLLLDTYSGAAAAYSVRKLDKDYTGDCMRIRRSLDSAESSIGFDSNGDLDTAAIAAFATEGDAFVVTWFDQSGNGNNATQGTTSAQPKIYSSGAMVTENGKPAVDFDGTDDGLEIDYTSTFANISAWSVHTGTNGAVVSTYSIADGQKHFWAHDMSSNKYRMIVRNTANTLVQISTGTTSDTQVLQNTIYDRATLEVAVDGGTAASAAGALGDIATQSTGIALGKQPSNASFLNGNLQEILIYNSDESSNRTGIEGNINTYFSIYT